MRKLLPIDAWFWGVFTYKFSTYWPLPVFPDVGIKSCPNFPNAAPKVSSAVFTKILFFIIAKNVTKYLGYFWRKICCLELTKILQSGHTGHYIQLILMGRKRSSNIMHHSSMAGLPFDWFGFSNFSTNRNIFFVWSKTIQLNWRPLWQVLSLSTIMQCDQRGHFGRISKVFGFFWAFI